MSFKKRILEEAQKTFSPKLSKPLSNTLRKAGNFIPGALGGNILNKAAANIDRNRRNMAQDIKAARRVGGNLGKVVSHQISKKNIVPKINSNGSKSSFDFNKTLMGIPKVKSLAKDGWILPGMQLSDIKKDIEANPNTYVASVRPGLAERLVNKKFKADKSFEGNGYDLGLIPTNVGPKPGENTQASNVNPFAQYQQEPAPIKSKKRPKTKIVPPNQVEDIRLRLVGL